MATDRRPSKPYPDFPLFAHATGQWAKKVRGRLRYFGVWADPDAALARFLAERDALYGGREPRRDAPGLTVAALANHFLTRKRQQVEAGELSPRMWSDYHAVCEAVVGSLGGDRVVPGLVPDDFARVRADAAVRLGPVALGVFVQRVRTLFKHAFDSDLIDRPARFGPAFVKPSKRVERRARQSRGAKLVSAADARTLNEAADVHLRAMILLGLNCGFGQSDCAELPRAALDLAGGWIDFPRPKTGVGRRCPLWPETVAALRASLADRPTPRDPASDLVFITKYGQPWVRYRDRGAEARGTRSDAVLGQFRKLVRGAGVVAPGFYSLRHTFRTVADALPDRPAIDLIMGHHDPSMGGVYRERIADGRLQAVASHVRRWLFPLPKRQPRARKKDS